MESLASNLTFLLVTLALFLFYLAVAERSEQSPIDRLIMAAILCVGHATVVPLTLMASHLASLAWLLSLSLVIVGLWARLLRIRPSSLALAARRTLHELQVSFTPYLAGLGFAAILLIPITLFACRLTGTVMTGGTGEMLNATLSVSRTLTWFPIAIVGITVGLFVMTGAKPGNRPPPANDAWWLRGLTCVPLMLVVGLLLSRLVAGMLLEPFTNDGLEFHLPVAANLLQYGEYKDYASRGLVNNLSWHASMDGCSKNLAMMHFWTLCLSRQLTFSFAISWFMAAMSVLVVFRLCRMLGCATRHALIAAPLALVNRISPDQMITCMPDQILTDLILMACWCALRPTTGRNLLMLALVTGIITGTHRLTLIPVCGLIIVLFLARWYWNYRKAKPSDPPVRTTQAGDKRFWVWLIAIAIFGLIGLYQPVYNTLAHQNPFYPFHFEVGSHVFNGTIDVSTYNQDPTRYRGAQSALGRFAVSICTVWQDYRRAMRAGGWGLLFPLVLLPTHIVAVWIRRRDGPYLCFAALSWLALMLTGQAYWLRYSLYFFMLSVVPLAVVLDNLRRWRGGLLFALAMLATLMMVKGGLVVGPRETMLTDWRPYLACQNRWERIAFISRHPTADTGRAIHVDHLGRDVVYSDIYKKLLFWDARFANRVEAIHYASADALRHWLREQQLDQPVIAVTRGSNEARWLASSQHFTTVYTNEHELLFRPTLQTASSPDRP